MKSVSPAAIILNEQHFVNQGIIKTSGRQTLSQMFISRLHHGTGHRIIFI